MTAPLATDRRRRVDLAAALVLAAAYAGWASGPPPFSVTADVLVAVPSAVFVAGLVAQERWPSRRPWRRLPPLRSRRATSSAPWVILICVLAGVELASFFAGAPRGAHPTLSSALDAVFRVRAAKAAVYLGWLTVGWYLVRR